MPEPYVIKMPQLSDTMVEGVIVSWEKQPGEAIRRGDIVATVETDKAIMDVEVFRDGYLSGPLAPVDSVVPVGAPIAYLVAAPEEVQNAEAESSASVAPASTPAVRPMPAAASAGKAAPKNEPEGATYVIKMPQLSDTMAEGTVVAWVKQPGDAVGRGDVVAQVETDKAIMDVEVFRDGYLSGPFAPVDAVVAVGGALAHLVSDPEQVVRDASAPPAMSQDDDVTSPSAQVERHRIARAHPAPRQAPLPTHGTTALAPAPRPDNRHATPQARRLASELHVNLNTVKGTGPDGVITADDVRHAQRIERPREVTPLPAPHALPEVQVPGEGRSMTAMERAVAHAMTAALTMPLFRVTRHVDATRLQRTAKRLKISMTVAVAKACALAMKQHATMNWAYQPVDKLVERDGVDIGIAVAAKDGGLVVPVLRHCETRRLQELDQSWKELVARARVRRLKPEEYANPTFQISNMGMLGVSQFDAIPVPGTAAILAISSAQTQGMPMTITADHRVVNGAEVALYLKTLAELIEQPQRWMGTPGPAIPEGEWDYPVVVIGGGPGGEDCARALAERGIRVALINDAALPGGECLWRGCIPSKTWRAAADRVRDRGHDARLGVTNTNRARLDWSVLEQTRREVLEGRGELALKTDRGMKIDYIQGYAWFESEHRVFVDTTGNAQDPHRRAPKGDGSQGRHVSFGCAVIASGAPAFVPPIAGAWQGVSNGGVRTSDTIWDLPERPKRLVIVGAGAIGAEMAQMFQDFGTRVTLLEAQPRVLPEMDAEIAAQLGKILGADPRLDVRTGVKVARMRGKPGAMQTEYRDAEGKKHNVRSDYVLIATGKRPELEPMKLNEAGLQAEHNVIRVDAHCRTNVEHIYAIGDAIGGLMLAHTAGHQGRVAAANILGQDLRYDPDVDCGVIFTRPQAAFAGVTLERAKAKGIDAVEIKTPLAIDAKAQITGETEGFIKLVVDRASRRIVGVQMLADHADNLMGEAVLLVSAGLTLDRVAHAIHPHPTQTELFGELARRLLARFERSARAAGKAAAKV